MMVSIKLKTHLQVKIYRGEYMTEQGLNKFKQIIYDPYTEAWVIMKAMRDKEPKDDAFWKDYTEKCNAFKEKYPTEIGESIYRVLLDCGSEVGRIERQK